MEFLYYDWSVFAHDYQRAPKSNFTTWLFMGGRGAGKTRAGAEWVRMLAKTSAAKLSQDEQIKVALIGQTYADVREVMIEGPSGLLAVHPPSQRPKWIPSRRLLQWQNGATAYAFSSEDPEALRGPQFTHAWCDEIGKWQNAIETYDMLQFGLRLGERPQQLLTTTPRPTPLLKMLLKNHSRHEAVTGGEEKAEVDTGFYLTHATTKDNAAFLAPSFLQGVFNKYAGTRLGRQELQGELIADSEDSLFQRVWFEKERLAQAPELVKVVLAVDPPATSGKQADACGIVAVGLDEKSHLYVIADHSRQGLRPAQWASHVVHVAQHLQADYVVAETNQGGEMVAQMIASIDPAVPVKSVHASTSKSRRAEPVALLYEQGKVHHTGSFPELEDELMSLSMSENTSGYRAKNKKSPDRADALIWAIRELALKPKATPKMRVL